MTTDHILTFLFTDIEGSTQLWQTHRDSMPANLTRHDAILNEEIAKHGGQIVKHLGDGIFAVFDNGQPLHAAVAVQRRFRQEKWGPPGEIRIRMGLHAGHAEQRGTDYFGLSVNRAARVMAVGWGGQILITPDVLRYCPLPPDARTEDLGVHLLKDLAEPQPILGVCHPDLIAEFPALRSLSAQPNNLPPQTTPFIGREDELGDLTRLLDERDCRLITLIGPGGMGKTRLSLQVAAEEVGQYSHGVYFVSLAPLGSPRLVPNAVADALKYSFPQGEDLKEQLVGYLKQKQVLLVMDNFEHVVEGAGLVADLLREAPDVRVLATSRERLNLQAECVYELAGLDTPDNVDATVFEEFEAVEMFVAYAQRAQPGFTLDPADRPAVVSICKLIGGMPLAIQLAATWVRSLSLREIADELKADLDFLSTSQRDLPERHRSMRAAFDYSWNLLSEDEKSSFARLSVFRGGFTREAAKAVAGVSLPVLSSLVDKSLVQHEMTGRYQMHELVRQYAAEKLADQPGEPERVAESHAAYFANWMDQQTPAVSTARTTDVVKPWDADLDNIREAWRWAVGARHVAILAQLSEPIHWHGQLRARYLEACDMLEAADRSLSSGPLARDGELALADLLVYLAWFRIRLGRLELSRESALRAQGIFDRLQTPPPPSAGVYPLLPLSIIASIVGDFDEAERLGLDGYQQAVKRNGRADIMQACYVLISAYGGQGRYDEARRYGEEGLKVAELIDSHWFKAYILNELGRIAQAQGQYEQARSYFQQSHDIRREFDDPEGMAVALLHIGELALLHGDRDEARRCFTRGLEVYRDLGDQGGLADTLHGLGSLALADGDLPAARQHLREALQIAAGMSFVPLMLSMLADIGTYWIAARQPDKGLDALALAATHPASGPDVKNRAQDALKGHGGPERSIQPDRLPDVTRQMLDALA